MQRDRLLELPGANVIDHVGITLTGRSRVVRRTARATKPQVEHDVHRI